MSDLLPVPVTSAEIMDRPVPAPDQYPAAVYLARLAPGSRRSIRQSLDVIARILGQTDCMNTPWHELRYQHTQAVRARLSEGYLGATTNRHIAALRGVLREAFRLGLMSAETYTRAADIQNVKNARIPKGRALSEDEIRKLLGVCGTSLSGRRNAAIIGVLYAGGMRRAEICALTLDDWNPDDASLLVRHGKGNKSRLVYLTADAAERLVAWISVRGDTEGPLFCAVTKGGQKSIERGLTPESILLVLKALAKAAGVAKFSPHDLRRTCITQLLKKGVNLSTVQDIAGHASIATTKLYDHSGEDAKRVAVQKLSLV